MAVRAIAAFRRMLARILQAGPIPRHVAFIMDGNRRFADRALSGNVASGHTKGFDKVLDFAIRYSNFVVKGHASTGS